MHYTILSTLLKIIFIMQKNPFEKLDSSHEHIPPSSENTEQQPRTKRVVRHTQQ